MWWGLVDGVLGSFDARAGMERRWVEKQWMRKM